MLLYEQCHLGTLVSSGLPEEQQMAVLVVTDLLLIQYHTAGAQLVLRYQHDHAVVHIIDRLQYNPALFGGCEFQHFLMTRWFG